MEVAPETFLLMEGAAEWTILDSETVLNSVAEAAEALVDHLVGQGFVPVRSNDAHDGTQG